MVCSRLVRVCLALLLLALLAVVVRLAWLSDDAYITLRTVENFVEGRGLRWNTGDRVQAYTHPAWMLLLAAGRWLTGESYLTTIAIGILLSAVVVIRMVQLAATAAVAVATLMLLLCSRAFTEYATSGLENPLANVLLVLFVAAFVDARVPGGNLVRMGWIAALLGTTRLDLLLLVLPALLAAARPAAWPARWRALAGAAPLLAWLVFATVYYGSPFPITAYAKAFAHGVPAGELATQGLHYLVACACHDPLTSSAIGLGIVVGMVRPQLGCRALACGALIYVAYVVKIGGDFMVGRFLTAPFVLAVAVLAKALATAPRRALVGFGAAAPALLLLGGWPAFLVPPHDETGPETHHHGVVDERRSYHDSLGLFGRHRTVPPPGVASAALRANGLGPMIVTWGQVGRYAFEAGDLVHVCDVWLLDPLLMRLPIAQPGQWRVGHFERRIPEGYLESLATGENRIRDAGLRRYYDALRLMVQGPVFDGARWRAMLALWSGAYDADLRAFVDGEYRHAPRVAIAAGELSPPSPIGSYWYHEPRTRIVYAGGLEVAFAEPVLATRLRVRVLGLAEYRFQLRRQGVVTTTLRLQPTARWELGLQEYLVEVPAAAGAFDAVLVDGATTFDTISCLGGLAPER